MVASRLVPLGPSLSMTSASREVLTGGGPALHKGPAVPRWRVRNVFASRAEREAKSRTEEYDMQKRRMSTFQTD